MLLFKSTTAGRPAKVWASPDGSGSIGSRVSSRDEAHIEDLSLSSTPDERTAYGNGPTLTVWVRAWENNSYGVAIAGPNQEANWAMGESLVAFLEN